MGLIAVVVAAAVVTASVDHARGGQIVPGAALAAKRVAARLPAGTKVAAVDAPGIEDLLSPSGGPIPLIAAAPKPSGQSAAPTPPPSGGSSSPLPFPPPQVPVPAVPAAVQPVVGLASPVSFFACQYFGLVPLVAALGGALGSPVPLTDLLPYMAPLFNACLVPGVPASETTCAVDKQLDDGAALPEIPVALDLTLGEIVQGVPLPKPEGLAVDEVTQVEHATLGPADAGGGRPSDALVSALDCTQR